MKSWEFTPIRSENGQMMGKLSTSEQKQDNEGTTLKNTCNSKEEPQNGSCMLASQVENKKTTSKGKSKNCEDAIQIVNSLQTSEVVLTSNGKDFLPYWTESCQEMSQNWLSLTKTACAGSDLNCLSTLQQKTTAKSWFSTTLASPLKKKLSKTFFPSSTSFPSDFTDSGSIVTRSRKIRIYPKPESRTRARQFLGLTRYWYNQAIAYLRQPDTKATLSELRALQNPENHPEWAFTCPQRVREHAFSDAIRAVKAAKRKCIKGEGFQKVSFRRKKDPKQRFGFDKKSLNELFCFRRTQDRIHFLSSEEFTVGCEGTEIVREKGRWFLILPEKRQQVQPENQRLPICSLDPGVRTFLTLYSPWMVGHFGANDFGKISRLCKELDKLVGKIARSKKKKQRYRMRKASERLRWRIKDLIDDCHNKIAHFLVTRFEVILLPTFEVSQMVSKLRSKTARAMLTWSHYRFKKKLKAKAEEYSAEVLDVCEAYTSKTCSYCGAIQKIGGKKRMRCVCGVDVDRDGNGARGIMLRALVASPSLRCKMESALENIQCIVNEC